jgi:hypothetical protein
MNSSATSITSGAAQLQRPWYPYVVAIYPLWFLYLRNLGQVSATAALDATLVALVITYLLILLATRLTGSRAVAALITSALFIAFYAYGPMHDVAVRIAVNDRGQNLQAIGRVFENHLSLSSLLMGVSGLVIWLFITRVDRASTRITGAGNVAAGTLGAILLIRLFSAVVRQHESEVHHDRASIEAGTRLSVLGYNPDIYYIILDGYARADVLAEHYGFDNSPFIDELERRGFEVTDRSNANYNHTFLSLASSLNFDYLQNFAADILADEDFLQGRRGFEPIAKRLQDNRAAQFLRTRGYRFVHLQSSSPETVRNPYADEQIQCSGRVFDDEYFRAVAEISWLRALAPGSLVTDDLAECHKLRLQALADQGGRPGPKFVFTHFLPPHHPYLFDRHGNVLRTVTISNQFDYQARLWEYKAGYLDQLQYMNTSMLEVIDRIRAQSKQPPIIIVQSDHGPNLKKDLTVEQARSLRIANFAAYLLPGAAPGTLPPDCAPVNQFRYLFNHYFAADFPILPSRIFFSEFKTPLQMIELPTSATGQP